MPRKRAPPRLYLDGKRKQWVIRDGAAFIRTGCAEPDRGGAEKRLASYLSTKYRPQPNATPLIADILMAYATEHVPHKLSVRVIGDNMGKLSAWWGDKKLSDVTARACRAYTATHTPAVARRSLQTLRAAIHYWHKEYGPLPAVPAVVMPPPPEPREHWLTRSEAARLLWAARRTEHLRRFILLGLWTGSRPGAILSLTWDRLDLERGIMRRRGHGETESTTKRTPPVRLSKRALLFLRRWKKMDAGRSELVVHWNGRRIAKFRHAWKRAADQAGVRCTPHTLRHTRATWLMQAGIEPWEAAGHLGMSLQTLTRIYAKHHPDHQRRAAEV